MQARNSGYILLVEDNPYDAELTINALKQGNKNMQLIHMNNGVEALEYIIAKGVSSESNLYDDLKLVILDIKLPQMDGLEILKKIRENEKTKHLPVVILSSSKEWIDIKEAYKLGANSYVVKPVGFDNFTKVISTLGLYWTLVNESPV
jgi:two-component system response regulator